MMPAEVCPSGRRERTANALRGVKPLPGFKSLRLRSSEDKLLQEPAADPRRLVWVGTYAPVAQWIRASGYGPEGRGFESLRAYERRTGRVISGTDPPTI
jgi:hypothetical protein